MSTVLKLTNPSNELVISSDAYGIYCIGKAALQTLVQPTAGSPTGPAPGKKGGYSVYRISWPTPVLFAVDLPLNKRAGILSITQPSAGVWEITCYCGDGVDAYGFDANQYALDVWAYGVPQSPQTGMVFQVFRKDGTLAYDLTKPNPLFPRAYAVAAARGSGITIPSLSRPVIMGCPTSNFADSSFMSTNHWNYTVNHSVWRRDSATTVKEDVATLQRYEYSSVDPVGSSTDDAFATPCFIIEGTTLP